MTKQHDGVLERRFGVGHLFYSENRIRALGENSFEVLALAPLFQAYAEEDRLAFFCMAFQLQALAEASGISRDIIWQDN